jgi:predicted secreted Zn-dependent protease
MDPLNENPVTPAPAGLPFPLRVFIVFASSLCAGAGFGLTLWALPTVAPQQIVETTVRDTQQALETMLSTEKPCTPSPIGFDDPCEAPSGHTEAGTLDEYAGGVPTEEEPAVPAITDAGKKILLEGNQVLVIEEPLPAQIPKPTPTKPKPVQKQVSQPPKKVPATQTPQAPVAQPKPQPTKPQAIAQTNIVTPPVTQSPLTPVPQCTRNTSYVPAGALPLNPNGQPFQLTIEQPSYYTVYGRSPLEVRRQMAQCTPVQGGYDAVTHWWYRYSYNYNQKANGLCGISDVTLVLHITFLFPYFKDDGDNAGLTAQWSRYFTNLQTHEFGHRDITVQNAQSALAAIQAFPDAPCENIVQTVNAYADAQLDVIQQKNTGYDAQTRHGETQGAVFP